ncbi:13172_t:CDS:2 [Cetraspora pellucida]|uniref:13172_t:CDS:1 n=1 Tax=Cetraspora pellucida TaxID=1433469 RepID=A0ACA9MG35_9GLOM|nr:13172_t:CDS:2 [Cetraspora pellucida]
MTGTSTIDPNRLVPVKNSRRIKVTFNADTSRALHWSFTPQQREVRVLPGETALAFYTAKNESNQDIIEQMLGAGEQLDMPVFFFIDPEFENDPLMKDVDTVTLSYTFFKAKYDDNGVLIPIPA